MLRPLAEGRRANADVAFLMGLATVGAAEKPGLSDDARDALLDEAIGVFHAMLVERPGLLRVRLELARAFFLRGRDGLARRHFEQVLAGNPPAGVALNVHRFLGEIRARKRWTMRVGFALAPDTNIGAGSDDRIIYIHGLPFRRNQAEPDVLRHRRLGLGGRRIPASAGRPRNGVRGKPLAAARRRRHLAARVS